MSLGGPTFGQLDAPRREEKRTPMRTPSHAALCPQSSTQSSTNGHRPRRQLCSTLGKPPFTAQARQREKKTRYTLLNPVLAYCLLLARPILALRTASGLGQGDICLHLVTVVAATVVIDARDCAARVAGGGDTLRNALCGSIFVTTATLHPDAREHKADNQQNGLDALVHVGQR